MAIQIEWRNGTAAQWTSTNPTLAIGEVGVETDTGQFKIGTGSTVWTSLAYQGTAGPTQTQPYRSLGDGSDGNVTISSGVTTLSRDMFYNNLTINGSGQLYTANFKVFVKGVLDLTAAPVGAINNNGLSGGNASGSTGGTAPAAVAAGTLGANSNGGAGGAGGSFGNGSNGGAASGANIGNGGGSNGSGGGGTGNGTTAGTGAAGLTPTVLMINRWETNFLRGVSLLGGGSGVGGGGGGGGDGSVAAGGGGGAGGSGAGAILLYANIILTSSLTSASCIQAVGGSGGDGGNGDVIGGSTGGGGGGGGGCGGWIYILYNQRFGPLVANMLDTSSGDGGNGGNGFSTGNGGKGGSAGNGGTIQAYQIQAGVDYFYTAVNFVAAATWVPQLTGSSNVGTMGGFGGYAQTWRLNF